MNKAGFCMLITIWFPLLIMHSIWILIFKSYFMIWRMYLFSAGFYNAHVPVWLDWLRYVSFMARIWSAIVEIEWLYGQEFQ